MRALPLQLPGSLVTSRLVSRLTEVAMCRPASTARSSSTSRSVAVSPVIATRMPCTSGLPSCQRPGFGYGHGGRFFAARYEEPVQELRPAVCVSSSPRSVTATQACNGSGTPPWRARCRLGRKASASTRASSSALCACRCCTPKWAASEASLPFGSGRRRSRESTMVQIRWSTGARRPAREYSREIMFQSKSALWATITRPRSRSASSSAISRKVGAPRSTSLVRPWIQTGPGSRSGLTSVYHWSVTSPSSSNW